jgi:hypothetical protein
MRLTPPRLQEDDMSDEMTDSAAMLDKYNDYRTTVWFVDNPKAAAAATWQGHEVFETLSAAIESVNDNSNSYFGFDVVIHLPDEDRHVTQRELGPLIAEIKRRLAK